MEGVLKTSTTVTPKPSFLLNERVYSKLPGEPDQLWAIYAFEAVASKSLVEMGVAWSLSAIFFITNPKLSRTVRLRARKMLEKVLISTTPEIRIKSLDVIIAGMEEWLRQVSIWISLSFLMTDFRRTQRGASYDSR